MAGQPNGSPDGGGPGAGSPGAECLRGCSGSGRSMLPAACCRRHEGERCVSGAGAKGGSREYKGRAARPKRRPAAPRASPEAGPGFARPSWNPAGGGRAGLQRVIRPQGSRIGKAGALEASAAGRRGGPGKAGALQARAAGTGRRRQARFPKGGPGAATIRSGAKVPGRGKEEEGGAQGPEAAGAKGSVGGEGGAGLHSEDEGREAERDPRVPISKKLSTMLQWSSEEEGEGTVGGG
ncbi:hypothetical protein NDU88_006077, partial [Pleurodeles waltl]